MTKQEQEEPGQRALRTFERELPQLWEERPGQWVAYRGEQRLGFAKQKLEVYQRCFEQGVTREEFVVFCIEPLETEIIFGVDAGG